MSHHILVIDDQADFLELMKLRLGNAGFNVTTALGGNAGLVAIESMPPDLILLDMLMPDTDGLETYQRIREINESRTTPIILLTAMAVESHWEALDYDDGLSFVMGKPYDPKFVIQRINELLDGLGPKSE